MLIQVQLLQNVHKRNSLLIWSLKKAERFSEIKASYWHKWETYPHVSKSIFENSV